MIDEISLEDVEQFEERRLAKVRRKVSRVDSLKKFLFSSKLEEKKSKPNESASQYMRPITNVDQGYKASCLEVHDRWISVQQNVLKEEENEDDDNLSCLVNINMDIRSQSDLDSRYDIDITSPDSIMSSEKDNNKQIRHDLNWNLNENLHRNRDYLMKNNNHKSLENTTQSSKNRNEERGCIIKDKQVKYAESSGYDSDQLGSGISRSLTEQCKKVSRSYSQPSHNVRMKVLQQNQEKLKKQYLVGICKVHIWI